MTCIVAKIHKGKVHMAGDRLGSNGFTKKEFPLIKKVFKNGDFLIGYTTSFRMGQLLKHSWAPPKKSLDDTDDTYIFKTVPESILALFESSKFGHKDKTDYIAGNFLFGWRGRLFEMEDDMSVLEHEDMAAVGSGAYHALASLRTMEVIGWHDDNPEAALVTAIQVASEYQVGVSLSSDYLAESES